MRKTSAKQVKKHTIPDRAGILALVRAGDLTGALLLAQSEVERCGKAPELLRPMGEILLRLGRHAEALPWLEEACAAHPDDLDAWNQRALALSRLLRHAEAHQAYLQALHRGPRVPALLANIGANWNKAERFVEAEHWLRQGVALDANAADVQTNLACALIGQERMAEARVVVTALLQQGHRGMELLQAHAALLQAEGQQTEAEALVRQLLAHQPHNHRLRLLLSMVLGSLGRVDEQVRLMRELLAADPHLEAVQSSLVFSLNYAEEADAAELLAQARRYGAILQARQAARGDAPYANWHVPQQPKRLRVGLVSGDFRNHPVGYFLEAVVPLLRGSSIELVAYPTLHQQDALTQRMRPHFAQWRPLVGLDDAQAAQSIHDDGVQVLVDLSGHTKGHRLGVFAYKPAPVQATWLGYLGTTGVPQIDWLITDALMAPPGTQAELTERVWHMPGGFMHLSRPEGEVPCAPLASALAGGPVTLGCFNNLAKMTDAVVALWSRLLHALPQARLLLKCPQLQDAHATERTRARFAAHGIEAHRLTLEGPASRAEFLAAYNRVDIALDPFPYTGGTTTLEALWMGVPVLTLRGNRFMSRMGVSLLTCAGLPDWVADTPDDYVRIAVAQAHNREHLHRLRHSLRAQLEASPLMDSQRYAAQMEAMFWAMWRQWQHNSAGLAQPVQAGAVVHS